MKRIAFFLAMVLIALPISSFAFGFLNITNVNVTQLDAETYRLRLGAGWGGPTILAEDIATPSYAINVSDAKANLSGFALNGPAEAFNFFAAVDENIWGAGADPLWDGTENIRYEYWRPLGYEFGFDFKQAGGLPESMQLNFRGDLEWAYTYGINMRSRTINTYDIAYNETISGSYNVRFAAPIPEPATLMLFGFGLVGAAVVRRRAIK